MLLVGDKIATENFVGGITGGVNVTNISGINDAQWQLSWSFGASLHWRLSDEWHLCPEAYFKSPGGVSNLSGTWTSFPSIDTIISDREEWLATTYVAVPILMKYRIGVAYILAGPQVSYLVAATDNVRGVGPEGAMFTAEKSAFGRLNRWDVGLVGGLEFLLVPSFGIHSLRVGVRYYQGFIDVTTDPSSNLNSGCSVTLGIPIGGSPKSVE